MRANRTEIGKELELLSQYKKRLLRSHESRRTVPLRTADGSEQDRIGSARHMERVVR